MNLDETEVEVELTWREVDLLLEYAFVTGEELEQLKRFKGKSGYHVFKTTDYSITGFIADLVHHAKQTENDQLLAEFDELCVVMETAQGNW